MPIFCTISLEEAEHDEATRLVLGDAARLQVEELLVVEAAGGAGVAGAADVAGLDLEVRDRLGARAVGEDEVAVGLVRVGADGIRPDEHVADPDAAGTRALQRALVEHVARGVARPCGAGRPGSRGADRRRSSDRPNSSALRAGAGELDARVHAHDAAAEADDDVAEGRVALDAGLVGCRMHGVVVPLLHRDDLEVGAVADDDLDVLRELRGPDRGAGRSSRASSASPRSRGARARRPPLPSDRDDGRLGELGVRRDAQQVRLGARAPGDRRGQVLRAEDLAARGGTRRRRRPVLAARRRSDVDGDRVVRRAASSSRARRCGRSACASS